MNQKERLELIRQKHEEEQRRRKILIHRIIVAVALVLILTAVIFAIAMCVLSISNKIEQRENATPAPTIIPTEVVIENPYEISQQYYANSAFVGNSFADGMIIYDLIEGADYFSKVGLTVNDALNSPISEGNVNVVDKLNCDKKYSRIFMMFGENELGWKSQEAFTAQYGEIIDKTKEYQKDSKIYLLAITPITKKVSDENIDNTNNERIIMYNELIKQLAQDKGVIYADIHSAVKNEEELLPDDAASDGIHFGKEYYEKCLLYIQNNYK